MTENNYKWISDLHCLIDLHLHLDGAVSAGSARELAKLTGVALPEGDAELKDWLQVGENCRNLEDFLSHFAHIEPLLQGPEAIRLAVVNLMKELEEQGLMYAEIRFAPQKNGEDQEEIIRAALAGLREASFPAQLILCCMRGNNTKEANLTTVHLAKKYLGCGVCAVDLAGAEGLFPTEDFEEEFALARSLRVPVVIHAGEAAGPESVRAALRFGAVRIGHGVLSVQDPSLLQELAGRRTVLELCPTSNLCTGLFQRIADYPYSILKEAGVRVTINTDDPGIEGTTLKQELSLMAEEFSWTKNEIKQLLLTSADASFAEAEVKAQLRKKIEEELG